MINEGAEGKSEHELNEMILKITMKIKEEYPELSKYLEELKVTIPDEKHPEITLRNLRSYYNSLKDMLNKYILEQSQKEKV
jgi:sugar-specific transcriptional regulator TrmB